MMIIRIRVHGGEGDSIRIAGRKTQGVRLFDVSGDADERVVSAGLIRDADDDDDEGMPQATKTTPPKMQTKIPLILEPKIRMLHQMISVGGRGMTPRIVLSRHLIR